MRWLLSSRFMLPAFLLLALFALYLRGNGASRDPVSNTRRQIDVEFDTEGNILWDGRLYIHNPDAAKVAPVVHDTVPTDDHPPFGSRQWLLLSGAAFGCISIAALAAGLTMGLVSIDPFELHIILNADPMDCITEAEREELLVEKRHARRILPLVQRHHLLLVTLLLANAAANEALPLFLDALVPSWAAVSLSVTFVLLFGEIIPSAVFTGPNQLRISAALSGLVWVAVTCLSPLAYPIAKVLDHCFGRHSLQRYRKHELKAIIRMHGAVRDGACTSGEEHAEKTEKSSKAAEVLRLGGLTDDEITIIGGVLDLSRKRAVDVMVPLSELFMVAADTVLDAAVLEELTEQGHSRVPVYDGDKHNVRGIMLVKRLISIDPAAGHTVGQLELRSPLCILPDIPLLELLNEFQNGKSHMALVTNKPTVVEDCLKSGETIPCDIHLAGVVCLEDLIEAMIGEPIKDEFDLAPGGTPDVTVRVASPVCQKKGRLNELAQRARMGRVPASPGRLGLSSSGASYTSALNSLAVPIPAAEDKRHLSPADSKPVSYGTITVNGD